MVPNLSTSTQTNLLIYLCGGVFVLLGAFYFGRLVTFLFPKNLLIRKGNKVNDLPSTKQSKLDELLEKVSNQSKEKDV
tara:strand:+ start:270 stop:503 length:234 start_codon:yes stop_codon:yes gene_type:complete